MLPNPAFSLILPHIDLQRCTGCGVCVEVCPTHAVELVRHQPVITRPDACTFCEECERSCPEGAIGRPFTIAFSPPAPPRHARG